MSSPGFRGLHLTRPSGRSLHSDPTHGLWSQGRMTRSRRGSELTTTTSMSRSQSLYPCDPTSNSTHTDDQDHGGVAVLYPPHLDSSNVLEQQRRGLSSRGSITGDTSWNTDYIEGGVRLSSYPISEPHHFSPYSPNNSNVFLQFGNNNDTALYSSPNEPIAGALTARTSLPTFQMSNSPDAYAPLRVSEAARIISSSPVEATSSTRWPDTETTQTIHQLQPTLELGHQNYSWIDYDITDFLERWDIQYDMGEAGLMHVDEERRRQWQGPNKDQSSSVPRDIQGLDWSALKTSRSRARMARRMLYPLGYSWDPTSQQELLDYPQQHMYSFGGYYQHHKAQFSHGQLRHVLAARSRNDIFYAAKHKVMHTSLTSPAYANTVMDLSGASTNPSRTAGDTLITTIDVSPMSVFGGYYSDAVLVAGGFMGEYALLNLNSTIGEAATEGFVTHAHESITTHVHTLSHRRTGALGACFCSNDRNVRVLDVGTNRWTHEFEYANEINCAATSPDGRLRAVVGDMCETLITDAERGDVLFSTRHHTGYGFACAWADDGWHVATGSEDGKVVVYDARRWDMPLVTLACEMSCARSLHFTTSNRGGPALVVAESDDMVTVYDVVNMWHDRQTIDFFGSVVGAASVGDGQELIVANGDRTVGGLLVFERQEHLEEDVYGNYELDFSSQQRSQNSRKRSSHVDDEMVESFPKRFGLDFDDLVL